MFYFKKIYTPLFTKYLLGYIMRLEVRRLENNCCKKQTKRSEGEKKIINNRLNRIEGQVRGVKKMIEEDRYCDDVLIQLSAINKSIKSLANHILENHMYTCVYNDLEKGNYEIIDEVVNLFRRFQ